MASPVPVIDLAAEAGPDTSASALALVRCATETVGVVQVVNHGVPLDLISEFGRLGQRPDLSAGRRTGRGADDRVLRDLAFRYVAAGQSLAERVLGLYARAQGQPDGTFPVDPLPHLRVTVDGHPAWTYPANADDKDELLSEGARGSVLTVLALAGSRPGLLVQRPDGSWMPVPAVPGALQVFSGPLLTRWTNGRLRPGRHELLAVGAAARGAAAVLRYPALGRVPEPLAPFAGPAQARYAPALPWDRGPGDTRDYRPVFDPTAPAAWPAPKHSPCEPAAAGTGLGVVDR